MAPSLFDILPPELIVIIVNAVAPKDILPLKLSCKTFNAHVKDLLPALVATQCKTSKTLPNNWYLRQMDMPYKRYRTSVTTAREQTIHFHAHAETLLVKDKTSNNKKQAKLPNLLCTDCGRIKPRSTFSDSQARSATISSERKSSDDHALFTYETRQCIPCGNKVGRKRDFYTKKASIQVGGEKCFVCEKCIEAKPLKEWVHLRQDDRKCCRACADKEGIGYTKASKAAGFAWAVYDKLITFKQLQKDHEEGKVQ